MLKNLLILLVLIALGAVGYFMFFNSNDSSIVSSGGTNVSSQAAFQTREFKNILNDLNTIDLNSELLRDNKFLQLRDHNQPVTERPYGRSNPFLINQ